MCEAKLEPKFSEMCTAYKTFPVLLQFAAKVYTLKNSGVHSGTIHLSLMVYVPVPLQRNFTHLRLHEGYFLALYIQKNESFSE